MVKATTVRSGDAQEDPAPVQVLGDRTGQERADEEGTTQAAEKAANTRPWIAGGYTRATTTYSATVCPPAPSPWISRPSTRISIVGASPAITRPTTNSATAAYSGAFGPDGRSTRRRRPCR